MSNKIGKSVPYNDTELIFEAPGQYANGTLAITCYSVDYGPWATISVNLEDYGFVPKDNQIVISHNVSPELTELFIDNFVDTNAETIWVPYGYTKGLLVTLKPEIVAEIESFKTSVG